MELSRVEKRKRLLMMACGAFAIFFTGYPHVWSVYQPYVMEEAGWTQGQASICFYLALAIFVFGNIVGGRIQDKSNPRMVIFVGGGIFAAGILLSAFMIKPSPIPMYLTYGAMQGFGQGMIYTTIISTAQKWFPGRTGFASGVVVTANGLCGFFLAPISRMLLEAVGPKGTLLAVGAVIALSWILCSIFFYVPDEGWQKEMQAQNRKEGDAAAVVQKEYTSSEMMKTKSFYLLLATMLFGLISYFMMSPVSQSHQIELGIPTVVAVSAVMFGSVLNAGTRLILPTLADKVGRVVCIKGVLIVSVAAMALLTVSRSYTATAAIILMYGCYGGIMGSFPSFTSSIFGIQHSGENYGFVMFGIVIATLGAPVISGIAGGSEAGMNAVFAVGTLFAVVALVCMQLLGRELKKMKSAEREASLREEYEHGISDNEVLTGMCEK